MRNISKEKAHSFYVQLKNYVHFNLSNGNPIEGYHRMIFPYVSAKAVADLMGIDQDKAKLFCEAMVIRSHDSERYYEEDGTVLYLVQ